MQASPQCDDLSAGDRERAHAAYARPRESRRLENLFIPEKVSPRRSEAGRLP